jgi:hypothetical protein
LAGYKKHKQQASIKHHNRNQKEEEEEGRENIKEKREGLNP